MIKNKDTDKTPEEDSTQEFVEAINEQKSDSLKAKLLALYKNQTRRDELLEKGYNESFYNLEYSYNLQYHNINKELSSIVLSGTPIPNYWKVAIENSKYFPVNDKDKEILKHLTNIEIKHHETDKKSVTVTFTFSKNDFFEHSILEKSYTFNKKEDTFTEAKSTEIKWTGQAPNIKTIKKKIKKGKTTSTITKEKKVESFFNIFESKEKEDEEEEEEEETEDDDLGTEADFLVNDLVPFSMEYFLDLQKLSALDGLDGGDDEGDDEGDDDKPKKYKK